MLSLLISVLVVCLVVGVFIWIVRLLPIPAPWNNVVIAVIALIALIWILETFLGGGGLGLRGALR